LTQIVSYKNNSFTEIFYDYLSPNVTLSATGIFLIGKNILTNRSTFSESLDKHSFGIYFIHIIILTKITEIIDVSIFQNNPIILFLYIILNSIFIYFTSFITIFMLAKIRPLKKLIT